MAVRPARVRLGALAALALAGCIDGPVEPPRGARIEIIAQPGAQLPVGAAVDPAPSFVIRDAAGRIMSDVDVAVLVTSGGGSLRGRPRRTAPTPTSMGEWTLGTHPGANVLLVRAGSLAPLSVRVDATPGAPYAIGSVDADEGSAPAGDALARPLAVRVVDRFGNPVSGVAVTFTVTAGGGELSAAAVPTDSNGVAGGVQWRLGRLGGAQEVSASAGSLRTAIHAVIRSNFNPVLRFYGDAPAPQARAAFERAVARLHAMLVADMPDVRLQAFDLARCGVPDIALTEVVDDVVIYATVNSIDGPGNIVASGGPCLTRSLSGVAVIGLIRFDRDDVDDLAASGRLDAVVLHEMLHVVGFGTLWRTMNLVTGTASDPRFQGAIGAGRCIALGGMAACGGGSIPVENTGGQGTADAHWRESVFDNELMTGYVEPAGEMPVSAMTLGSLEDLGHVANYLAADPYFVPLLTPRPRAGVPPAPRAPWEMLLTPRLEVTRAGWVRPIAPR